MFSDQSKLGTALRVLSAFIVMAVFHFAIGELFALFGTGGFAMAVDGLLASIFDDPELKEDWETAALAIGERKTEFTEAELGATFADDGPKQSDRVPASPILMYNGLQKGGGGGRFVNVRVEKPLYTSPQNILKNWRYSSQQRRGTEKKANRDSFRATVDLIFLALYEDQVKQGLQETANITAPVLMKRLTNKLTDNTAKRVDMGMFWALCAGFDHHHFVNVGLRNGLSNGAKPTSEAKAGVWLPPTEHPNMYAYYGGNMNKVSYNSTQATHSNNIDTAVSQITSADKPGLSWLRKVYRIAWRQHIIPAQIRVNGRTFNHYLLYVPGRVRDLLEQDSEFMNLFQRAYQGQVQNNPMLNDDDLMYKNLVIRDSKWLEEPYFDMSSSFNATGGTDSTDMTFNKTTTGGYEWADIDPGTRSVVTGSPLENDVNDITQIGRCFLLGANAAIRTTGKDYGLTRMEVTDYGKKDGIGQDKYFGQQRIDTFNKQGSFQQTPQSICFIVFQGQD